MALQLNQQPHFLLQAEASRLCWNNIVLNLKLLLFSLQLTSKVDTWSTPIQSPGRKTVWVRTGFIALIPFQIASTEVANLLATLVWGCLHKRRWWTKLSCCCCRPTSLGGQRCWFRFGSLCSREPNERTVQPGTRQWRRLTPSPNSNPAAAPINLIYRHHYRVDLQLSRRRRC